MKSCLNACFSLVCLLILVLFVTSESIAQTPPNFDTIIRPGYYCNSPVNLNGDLILTAKCGTSWSWTGPNGFSSQRANVSLPNVSSSAAGTYYLTSYDSIKDSTYNFNFNVDVTPAWTNQIHIQFDWTDICDNTPTQFSTPIINGATYLWTVVQGGANISNPLNANPVITFPFAQSPVDVYTVSLVITIGGVQTLYTQNINVNKCCTDPPPPGFPLGSGKLLIKDLSINQVNLITGNFLNSPFPIKIAIKGALTLNNDWYVNQNAILKD